VYTNKGRETIWRQGRNWIWEIDSKKERKDRGWEGQMSERDRNSAITDTGGKKTCQKRSTFSEMSCTNISKKFLITNLVQCGPQIMSHIQQCKHMTIKISLSSGMWHHVVRQECTNISGTPPQQRQQDPLNTSIVLPDYTALHFRRQQQSKSLLQEPQTSTG